ncbi:MAG: ribosome silencing factor [Candidatus Cloacimonetes bacterium]|nr:ribosome silencing factor [Candidatus Cloacimonadota bacterium]
MEQTQRETLEQIVSWILAKKGENLVTIDVKEKSDFADFLIICHGTAELHVRAIGQHIIDMAKEAELHVLHSEGMKSGSWVLIDFGDIIVHIFTEKTRDYYRLEELWNVNADSKKKFELSHATS